LQPCLQLQWAACAGVDMMWRHTYGSKQSTKFRPSRPKCPLSAYRASTRISAYNLLYIFRN